MLKSLKLLAYPFILLVLSALPATSHAFTAIASIDGEILNSFYRSSNFDTQKEADLAALEGCRTEARSNGIGKLARNCKIVMRAKGPGYGSVVCGSNGCGYVTGFDSSQAAIDAAYEYCTRTYADCQDKNIPYWEDFAGFNKKTAAPAPGKQVNAGDCRPRSNVLRCSSSCTNGNCIVSYENGCRMRVQVNPLFNGSQWVYPAPSC